MWMYPVIIGNSQAPRLNIGMAEAVDAIPLDVRDGADARKVEIAGDHRDRERRARHERPVALLADDPLGCSPAGHRGHAQRPQPIAQQAQAPAARTPTPPAASRSASSRPAHRPKPGSAAMTTPGCSPRRRASPSIRGGIGRSADA